MSCTGKEEKGTEKRNCMLCKHFLSFRDEYEDLLEPFDFGTCDNEHSELEGNEGAGIDRVCSCFEIKAKFI